MTALSIPSPPFSTFQVGPITIHYYALCLLTGMIIAVIVTNQRLIARGVPSGKVIDIAIWAIPIALVGGRLYHVFTHPNDYLSPGDNLWNILAIWQGGLAIFGSILFGTVGAYIGCRHAGVRFLTFADALAPGMLLAQAFGRFGNYFNQELYGPPTKLPWGLQISTSSPAYPAGLPAGTLFQPLFLYEMLWNIGGALLLIFVLQRRFNLHRGQAIGFYFLWYGLIRTPLEAVRDDPTELWVGLKINEDVAILAAVLGLLLILACRRREPLATIDGHAILEPQLNALPDPEPESAATVPTASPETAPADPTKT